MKLWVFGHSGCLPWHLINGVGWVEQVAKSLGIDHENCAEAAADNLFIYHSFINRLPDLDADDVVIIGWSHPNRKSFVFDHTNPAHVRARDHGCMMFNSRPDFFRSKGTDTDTRQKLATMSPVHLGNPFFDTWFDHYHSTYECRLNFNAYCDSVHQRAPCRYIPFYFSKESVEQPKDGEFYWLDFILETQCWISDHDMHPNQQGHDEIAKIFLKSLDTAYHQRLQ